ncbi:MAG: heavy metal-binding domain-containing protein [Eubacteriaceae bacterium]|jgi:uncharacterized protein YbjQ (UPF0145 family)
MLVITSDFVYGKNCEALGLVSGNTVQSTNLVKDIGAGFKSMVGGELKSYTEMMTQARQLAEDRMVEQAKSLGADAIISMRFTSGAVTQNSAEVLAFGTAVKFI